MTVIPFPTQRTDRDRAEQHITRALEHVDQALDLIQRAHACVKDDTDLFARDMPGFVMQARLLRSHLHHGIGGDAA